MREEPPQARITGTEVSVLVVAVRSSQQRSGLASPWERRKLVDRGNEECRKPPVKRLVNGNYRQGGSLPNSLSKLMQCTLRSPGLAGSGRRSNESGDNFSLHHGDSSRGIGEGFLVGSILK